LPLEFARALIAACLKYSNRLPQGTALKIWSTALLLGTLLLGGCGGGGGGSSGSSGSLSVSFSSTTVHFVGVVGGASGLQASQPQIDVTLKNGSGNYYATANSDSPYVTARFTTQSDTNGVIFFAMTGNPPPGHHGGLVTFVVCGDSSCGNILSTTQIPFTYDLYGFENPTLSLTAAPGGSLVSGVASIVPAPPAGTFSVTSDSPWLGGSLAGGTLTVNVNPIALTDGTYFGNLRLRSGLGEIDLAVSVGVGNSPGSSAQNIVVASDSTYQSLSRTVPINYPSTASYYSASADVPWLAVPGIGVALQVGSPLTFSINTQYLAGMQNYTSVTGNITVSSYGYPDILIPVTVTLDLASIYQVTSRPLLAGATGQAIDVRGRGFAALTSGSPFYIEPYGSVASTTDIISDSEVIISLPFAPTAGTYQIEATNPLSQTVTSAYFAATPATGVAAATVPITSGTNSQVMYDPVRGSVLNLDLQNGRLYEYAYSNGSWTTSQCVFAGAVGMTLTPDQGSVYVGSNLNKIYSYGPALSTTCPSSASIDASGLSGVTPSQFFAETYDDRIWVARSSTANYYYDLQASSFGSAALGGNTGVTLGSQDGSLIIGSHPGGSAAIYTASTQAVTSVTGAPAFSNGSFSSYSGLLLADYATVYRVGSSAMTATGFVPVESGFTNYGAVISADGSRVYALEGDPSTAIIDHISVYDSTLNIGVAFNLLGQIALPTKASDCTGIPVCNAAGQLTADPNGRNLYWVGNKYLIVIPVTSALYPVENKFHVAHVPKHS
jgi:hypothetical protein